MACRCDPVVDGVLFTMVTVLRVKGKGGTVSSTRTSSATGGVTELVREIRRIDGRFDQRLLATAVPSLRGFKNEASCVSPARTVTFRMSETVSPFFS